ncbi:MAG: VirB3 family type IV secretion system protein [Alphaproteobacteria bacterium]|nr:VirB3 family type IV secretion system protein [Alphaproteobacteria bacterium]MBN2780134.1 VirB3 family type IV secretion system protein [Alphaproteobacteria bacterium]
MKEHVFRAVASPPMFMWASFQLALMNFIGQFALMLIVLVITKGKMNPIIFIASIAIVHLILVAIHKREPHMATILRNLGRVKKKTIRLDGESANKFSA